MEKEKGIRLGGKEKVKKGTETKDRGVGWCKEEGERKKVKKGEGGDTERKGERWKTRKKLS